MREASLGPSMFALFCFLSCHIFLKNCDLAMIRVICWCMDAGSLFKDSVKAFWAGYEITRNLRHAEYLNTLHSRSAASCDLKSVVEPWLPFECGATLYANPRTQLNSDQ